MILYPTVTAESWEQVHPIPGDLPAESPDEKTWCHRAGRGSWIRNRNRPFFAEGFVSGSWKQKWEATRVCYWKCWENPFLPNGFADHYPY